MLSRRDALLGGALFATATATQTFARSAATSAALTRIDPARVAIDWAIAGPFDVRMSIQPDGAFSDIVARQVREEWKGEGPITPRPYYRVTGPAGADEVAERVLPLQGGRNFRDLGGYRAGDGRMVRWGQLYRSGSMANLTEGDHRYLSALGVKVICDFRTTGERTREPTRWEGPEIRTRDYDMDTAFYKRFAGPPAPDAAQARQHMITLYETLAYDQAESYRTMFAELVNGHTPLAFNCSAGKDRTGVAAALILTALGVPRATVVQDFELTNKTVDLRAISRKAGAGKAPAGFPDLSTLPPAALDAMMRADGAYLQSAFAAMTRRDGSVSGFLEKRCGLTPAGAQTLRRRLLKTV